MRQAIGPILAIWCSIVALAGLDARELELSTQRVRGAPAQRVDRYLSWAEQFGFSGVALLALEGDVVLHKAYGLADRGNTIPNRLDTVFSFGSIAKQFTAAAVMRLEQQGKLRTDEILTPASKRKVFAPYSEGYGYGWVVRKTDRGTTMHEHDGGSVLGLSALFQRFVEEDGAFILASNATIGDSLAIEYLTRPVSRLIFDDVRPLGEPPVLLSRDEQADRHVGEYALAGGGRFVIDTDGGQLFFSVAGQDALEAVDTRTKPHATAAAALNTQAKKVLQGMFSDDLEPLQAAFTKTGESTAQRAARWSRLLKSPRAARGAFRRAEVLGTTNIGDDGDVELVTWFRLHFSGGQRVWRFHWQDGRLRGLGGDVWPFPFYGPLRFKPAGDGVVFHFPSGRAVGVRFEPVDSGQVESISVAGHQGPISARRVKTP